MFKVKITKVERACPGFLLVRSEELNISFHLLFPYKFKTNVFFGTWFCLKADKFGFEYTLWNNLFSMSKIYHHIKQHFAFKWFVQGHLKHNGKFSLSRATLSFEFVQANQREKGVIFFYTKLVNWDIMGIVMSDLQQSLEGEWSPRESTLDKSPKWRLWDCTPPETPWKGKAWRMKIQTRITFLELLSLVFPSLIFISYKKNH